jgi:hypothetical protein
VPPSYGASVASERLVGRREGHLQVEDAHAHPAFAGQQLAKTVEDLGHPLGGRVDQQRHALAGVDLAAQLADEDVRLVL